MVTILASSGIARIANIGFRTGWISKEASRISDNVQKRQLDESSPVQKISELDWIPNWLKTRPIVLGLTVLLIELVHGTVSNRPQVQKSNWPQVGFLAGTGLSWREHDLSSQIWTTVRFHSINTIFLCARLPIYRSYRIHIK